MAKTQSETVAAPRPGRREAPPLSPGVRRHLGRSLRNHYAGTLDAPVSGPVSERLEALLAKLEAVD